MYEHCIHLGEIHSEVSADLDHCCAVPRSRAAAIPSTPEIFNQSTCQTGTPHRRLSLPSRLVADKLMQVRRSDELQHLGMQLHVCLLDPITAYAEAEYPWSKVVSNCFLSAGWVGRTSLSMSLTELVQ